jgi:hypothetical protein
MRYFIVAMVLSSCAAQPQFIEIADLWEPNWLFDCLERGTPEEKCEPPSEQEFCPVHRRIMVANDEFENR